MHRHYDRVITARAVVTEASQPALHDVAVAVHNGRVVEILPSEQIPAGTETLDLGDTVLFPGLIDTHVHLGFDGSSEPEAPMTRGDEAALREHALQQGRAFLRSGVTTVRDLGCSGTVISELAASERLASPLPRIFAADQPLGVPGGHCHYMSTSCDGLPELLTAVGVLAAQGAHTVKIMLTGGFIDDGGEAAHRVVYSLETLRTLTQRAHELGLKVAVHAHNTEAILRSARAGVDTIEHCSMMDRTGIASEAAPYRELAASGVYAVPTVSALWDVDLPWAPQDEALDAIRRLVQHRVPIAYGSDTGIPGAFPGRPLDGLNVLVRAGMSAGEALQSATVNAADALGRASELGRLLPGYHADMLVLDGDPTQTLEVIARPRAIIAAGEVVHSDGEWIK